MEANLQTRLFEIVAELDKKAEESVAIINKLISPVIPLSRDDIHMRTMLVTSDEVNSQGGRFSDDELPHLAELIPGSPILVGHDKSRLPIARCFKSELVERGSRTWVKAWFYWLKSTAGAADLARNIDGGIYTECSLGFSFGFPECCICSGDIRKCSHVAGREYRLESGERTSCHFIYRNVSRVNEISLVYRGAVAGTAISDHIAMSRASRQPRPHCELVPDATSVDLPRSGCIAYPIYHGVPFQFEQSGTRCSSSLPAEWAEFPAVKRALGMLEGIFEVGTKLSGVVTMYRGKSRLPVYLMEKIRRGEASLSPRCRLKLYVPQEIRPAVSDAEADRLGASNIDLVVKKQLESKQELESAVASAPHEGLRIEDNNDGTIVTRNGNRYLLKVLAVSLTGSGKYCLDLSFTDSQSGRHRSYETSIPASVGDTVYVEAEMTRLRERVSLRRIKVLDNLRGYYEPDKPRFDAEQGSSGHAEYALRKVGDNSALLEIENETDFSRIILPVFESRLLRDGKILVGYDARNAGKLNSSTLLDSGGLSILESTAGGRRLQFGGSMLRGEYILRSAVHRKENLIFVYCAESVGNTTLEIR